jgi:hypothetical protein
MRNLERNQARNRRRLWLCSGVALVVAALAAPLPARAQIPGVVRLPDPASAAPEFHYLAPTPAVPPVAQDLRTCYLETGPLFPVSGGFQRQLNMGWNVEVGAREILTCPDRPCALFAEIGGEYQSMEGRHGAIESTNVTVSLPTASQTLTGFHRTRLVELDHLGLQGGFGGIWYPACLNEAGCCPCAANQRLFLIGRLGARFGATHAVFHETPTAAGLTALNSFVTANGGQSAARNVTFGDPVLSHEPYFGCYSTFGVGTSWRHASLAGVPLGDVSVAAEVELGYTWDDLGQFDHQATLFSVSPKLLLGFSF